MEERNHENTLEKDLEAVGQEAQALEERLKAAEEELKGLKDKYLRLLADFDNYRKRMEEELKAREREGVLKALRALLPVLDDLDRALEFAEASPESIRQGVRAIRDGFFRILAGLGVEEVPGEGEAFDPRYHEAVGLLPGEPGKVAKVFQRGFRMGEALVRPARVAVGEEKQEEADLE
ncbi:nucleotide exchange factor GrpE [Thermus thermophilus]|uniref:Protein GrpE n=2 Tax=Thermus thermophilus TaxID=274 RepID=GRPE_THET2|nr:nucleotide exchange factor GrpE [Thermus thermophilus]Q72IK6.1 RecName: Full=Protein GrpE; AltName: Full=HSP-70 cofactor [Thermus thermophilus HB27]AAS81468.1 grpE protein [Thermus thermophilus HB27]QMV31184.1 nucleotide exchange factor GrpE [Thermus thermophilus]WMV94583.1 nucleotide exchange factor GrpE [Thermus thermophilus HB27]VCU52408.1 Protein GrpE [Thermus thermophilus]